MHPDMGTLAHTLTASQHGFRPFLPDYPSEGWTRLSEPEASFSERVEEPSAESSGRKRPGRARTPAFDRLMATAQRTSIPKHMPHLGPCLVRPRASLDRYGYDRISMFVRDKDGTERMKTVPAHRFMYEHYHNVSLTPEQNALHRCDNRACIDPCHLEVGTHAQNMEDMAEKGRSRTGNRISPVMRSTIHKMHEERHSMKAIARVLNTSLGSVKRILKAIRQEHTATHEPQGQGFLFQDTPVLLS